MQLDSIIQDSAIDGDIDLVEDDMDENILGNDFPTKESVLNDDSSSGSNTNDVGEETGEVNGENPPQENLDTGDGSNQETGDGKPGTSLIIQGACAALSVTGRARSVLMSSFFRMWISPALSAGDQGTPGMLTG